MMALAQPLLCSGQLLMLVVIIFVSSLGHACKLFGLTTHPHDFLQRPDATVRVPVRMRKRKVRLHDGAVLIMRDGVWVQISVWPLSRCANISCTELLGERHGLCVCQNAFLIILIVAIHEPVILRRPCSFVLQCLLLCGLRAHLLLVLSDELVLAFSDSIPGLDGDRFLHLLALQRSLVMRLLTGEANSLACFFGSFVSHCVELLPQSVIAHGALNNLCIQLLSGSCKLLLQNLSRCEDLRLHLAGCLKPCRLHGCSLSHDSHSLCFDNRRPHRFRQPDLLRLLRVVDALVCVCARERPECLQIQRLLLLEGAYRAAKVRGHLRLGQLYGFGHLALRRSSLLYLDLLCLISKLHGSVPHDKLDFGQCSLLNLLLSLLHCHRHAELVALSITPSFFGLCLGLDDALLGGLHRRNSLLLLFLHLLESSFLGSHFLHHLLASLRLGIEERLHLRAAHLQELVLEVGSIRLDTVQLREEVGFQI
mmetsp:Transcript_13091/g.34286  ORF Transcript_13091/g.34286 Transcript_13091/m.34286 type:complete len:480 (-) Transcript_13091:84-1523(-)